MGLPAPVEGTLYLVSIVVAGGLKNRPDCLVPGTGPNDGAIRYADGPLKGQIDAVTRFTRATM